MAAPVIDNLLLPIECMLVLPDTGSETTGTIFRRSSMGGGCFNSVLIESRQFPTPHAHVLFAKEMTSEVNVNGVEYLAMHEYAIVGLIPD